MNVIAVIARQYMHDDHMWRDGGWMWLWGTIMMLCVIVAVGLVVWFAARGAHSHQHGAPQDDAGARAREILAERYARGEISTEEYKERVTVLQ